MDNDKLFFSIWRNKWLLSLIFDNFKFSNQDFQLLDYKNYYLGHRIPFKKLNSLKWFIQKNRIDLLIDFLDNTTKEIKATRRGLTLLISKYKQEKDKELLFKVFKKTKINLNPNNKYFTQVDLIKLSIDSNNLISLKLLFNEMNIKLIDSNYDRETLYLGDCQKQEIFDFVFNEFLKENQIDINNNYQLIDEEKNKVLKSLFENLFNIKINCERRAEWLICYSNLVDMKGMFNSTSAFFRIRNIDNIKKIKDLDIYFPKKSNFIIYEELNLTNLTIEEMIEKIKIYIQIAYKFHLKGSQSSTLLDQKLIQINNLDKEYEEIKFTASNEFKFKLVEKYLNLIEFKHLNLYLMKPKFVKGYQLSLKNKYSFRDNQYLISTIYENCLADGLKFMIDRSLKPILYENLSYNYIFSKSNLFKSGNMEFWFDKLIEFLKLYHSIGYAHPIIFIESIFEKFNINYLDEIIKLGLIKVYLKTNKSFHFNFTIEKIQWFLKNSNFIFNSNFQLYENQIFFSKISLDSIEDIDYIKSEIPKYQYIKKSFKHYANVENLELLKYYSDNLVFSNNNLPLSLYSKNNNDFVIKEWIEYLNETKFKCFDNFGFKELILKLLYGGNIKTVQDFNNKYRINFLNLNDDNKISFLFYYSLFSLDLKVLKLILSNIGNNENINNYKSNFINYYKNFIYGNHKFPFKSLYKRKSNIKLKEILEFINSLFDLFSPLDIQEIKPIFNNFYQRILLMKSISLDTIIKIKQYFKNNGCIISETKQITHLYLIIKSKKYEKYIRDYIDPIPKRIDLVLFLELLNKDNDNKNHCNYSITFKKNYQIHSSYNNNNLSILNNLNLINSNDDFNSLFLELRNENCSNNYDILNFKDWNYYIEIQNLILFEKIILNQLKPKAFLCVILKENEIIKRITKIFDQEQKEDKEIINKLIKTLN